MDFLNDIELLFLSIKILLVFGWAGLICSVIIKKFVANSFTTNEIDLLSLGIAPYLITLLLYYLFLLLPSFSNNVYLIFILVIHLFFSFVYRKEIFSKVLYLKTNLLKFKWIFIPIVLFLIGWFYYISSKHITEHDTLEYAVQGKVFFRDKFIHYSAHRIDKLSEFYYVGLHGFSFPLLATFEMMINDLFGFQSDYFFRAINSIFGILILFFVFEISRKKINFLFGFFTTLALGMTYGFFETIMKYHIDLYRIFFLILSIYFCYTLINNYSKKVAIVCAVLLAAQANAHSLGCMLAIIQFALLFLFIDGSFLKKVNRIILAFIVFLLFGGIHYVFDVLYGTGWVFQDIKFY